MTHSIAPAAKAGQKTALADGPLREQDKVMKL
jgi:hypothetical protein